MKAFVVMLPIWLLILIIANSNIFELSLLIRIILVGFDILTAYYIFRIFLSEHRKKESDKHLS